MLKPIVKWTIGDVSKNGISCLKLSISNFIKIYGYDFDYYICYNNINLKKINFIEKYKINLIDQKKHMNSLKIRPTKNFNPCWKLYPPRINKNTHEISLDNDAIIYKKIPIIDLFLKNKNLNFISEAMFNSYGSFQNLINLKQNLNTGFFGLCPGFDLELEIEKILSKKILSDWNQGSNFHLNEQGLISYLFQENKINYKIVSLRDMYILHPTEKSKNTYEIGNYGIHFVMVNQNKNKNFIKYIKKVFPWIL